jgi:hypothetical protein
MRRFSAFAASAVLIGGMALGAAALGGDGKGGGHAGWSIAGPGTTSVEKGDRGSRILQYAYDIPSWEPEQAWEMAKTPEETGPLDLEWSIDGFHGWFLDWVEIYAFADGPGGRTVQTLVATPHGEFVSGEIDGPFQFEGRATVQTTAGYPFGFIVKGANFDSGGALVGSLTVKERD